MATMSEEVPMPSHNITLADIRRVIPKECFEISTLWGIYYFFKDLCLIGTMYYLREYFYVHWITRILWYLILGFFFVCLFVVGHDCGHRTFSKNDYVNDIFGHLAHTPLFFPFHGWRLSHRLHHKFTNHAKKDLAWTPLSSRAYSNWKEMAAKSWSEWIVFKWTFTPIINLTVLPLYLLGDRVHGNHFNPWVRYGRPCDRKPIAISSCAILIWICILIRLGTSYGFLVVWDLYVIPWIIFSMMFNLITYLHHTEADSRTFRDPKWTFVLGSLETVDRSYGSLIDYLMHYINVHLVHHLFFTEIPHYNLVAANKNMKSLLGDIHRYSGNFFLYDYFKAVEKCLFVPSKGQCVKYKNKLPDE